MSETFCHACGEEMEHWNHGVYECEECSSERNWEEIDEYILVNGELEGEGEEGL